MATIFHIAFASDWQAAQPTGEYSISTRGRTLAEEGFIHCSRGNQWPRIREAFYADVTEPLVLLKIDTDLVGVPVVEEPGEPGGTETFPHVYGPLPVAAVTTVIPLGEPERPVQAETEVPEPPTSGTPSQPEHPEYGRAAASRTFLTEMFVNALLLMLVMAVSILGYGVGRLLSDGEWVPFTTALVGLAVGGVLARRIYTRRHGA